MSVSSVMSEWWYYFAQHIMGIRWSKCYSGVLTYALPHAGCPTLLFWVYCLCRRLPTWPGGLSPVGSRRPNGSTGRTVSIRPHSSWWWLQNLLPVPSGRRDPSAQSTAVPGWRGEGLRSLKKRKYDSWKFVTSNTVSTGSFSSPKVNFKFKCLSKLDFKRILFLKVKRSRELLSNNAHSTKLGISSNVVFILENLSCFVSNCSCTVF